MKLPTINISHDALSRFDQALQKEWLVTNGLGGYASSTVLGINTRKYHGLLVAAMQPPGYRTVCLSKLDEDVYIDGNNIRLGANEFHGTIFPQGYQFLKTFSVSPFPKYVYDARGIIIQKMLYMPHDKNATIVIYDVANRSFCDATIKIYPLMSCRYFHDVIDRWKSPVELSQTQTDREVELAFNTSKTIIISRATEGRFSANPNWIERLLYREEERRGESNTDDAYQPGYFEFSMTEKQKAKFAIVTAAGENSQETKAILDEIGVAANDLENLLQQELDRRSGSLVKFHRLNKVVPKSDGLHWILLATEAFIVRGAHQRRSVIAGYFWFEPWGRDTFISLPGLMLVTGRFEDAKKVLLDFGGYCRQGLIPNFIEDSSGEPTYNTVDATLWYVNAILQYLKYTGDFNFVLRNFWKTLQSIIENHRKGTAFGIHVDSDGLIAHGPRLTWMDADVDGKAVTPRGGKAVEIQALWYNALRIMQMLAGKFEEKNLVETYSVMAEKARLGFNRKFWNIQENCLFDVVEESGVDASMRPNQIIAVSLDFSMLNNDKANRVVEAVQKELLTPYGLMTLARSNPRYKGVYLGDWRNRNQAYHNGAVWPWLIGPFTKAFLKTKGTNDLTVDYGLKNFIMPLFNQQIYQAGLGTLSEIYDGDPPHAARGCIAQAWSVAEPIRAYVEDLMQLRPKHEKKVLKA